MNDTIAYDNQEVLDIVIDYIDAVEDGDWEAAMSSASELDNKDCEVCQQFGRHLTALVAATATSLRPETKDELKQRAISEGVYIRDTVVCSESF